MDAIDEDYLDTKIITENISEFGPYPLHPAKAVSITSLGSGSEITELILSCTVSEETVFEQSLSDPKLKTFAVNNVDKLNNKNNKSEAESYQEVYTILQELLCMSNSASALNKNDCSYNFKISQADIQHDIAVQSIEEEKFAFVSRSQQTENTASKILNNNNKNNKSIIKTEYTINKEEKKLKPSHTLNRPLTHSKDMIIPATNKKENQKVTNSGDFRIKNKRNNRMKTENQAKISNKNQTTNKSYATEFYNKTKSNKNDKCHVFIPGITPDKFCSFKRNSNATLQKNQYLSKNPNADNTNKILKINNKKGKLTNKGKDNKSIFLKNLNLKSAKNVTQPKMKYTETKEQEIKLKRSNTRILPKSYLTDAATESMMKMLLKNKELHSKLYSEIIVPIVNESETKLFKTDSKVFANHSSVFFNNAFKIHEEQKKLKNKKIQNNIDIHTDSEKDKNLNSFSNSPDTQNVLLPISNIGTDNTSNDGKFADHTVTSTIDDGTDIITLSCHQASDITTIYTKTSKGNKEEEIKSDGSASLVVSKSIVDGLSEDRLEKSSEIIQLIDVETVKSIDVDSTLVFEARQKINSYPKITEQKLDLPQSKKFKKLALDKMSITKDAKVNTMITMKKNDNNDILNLQSKEIIKVCKSFNNGNDTLKNMLNYFIKPQRGSSVDVNTLSVGSSFTIYSTKNHESFISMKRRERKSGSRLFNSRVFSSEQFLRKISKTSYSNEKFTIQRSKELNKSPSKVISNDGCDSCKSLFENKFNYTSTSISPLSEVDSVGTISSCHHRIKASNMDKVLKKYNIINTTQDVITKINKLPFIGYECDWKKCTNDVWQFKLLNGGLFFIIRLDSGKERLRKIEPERRIISIGLHKYVFHRKSNVLNALCVNFVGECIRHCISAKKWDRIGLIPNLLTRCCTIVKFGSKWEHDMHDTKTKLGYNLDDNGFLSMKIVNNVLQTMWQITMNLEIEKECKWPHPEAKDINITMLVNNQPFGCCELINQLKQIKQSWSHVPRTLWTIYEHLKHLKADLRSISSYRSLTTGPSSRVQVVDNHVTISHIGIGGNNNNFRPNNVLYCNSNVSFDPFHS